MDKTKLTPQAQALIKRIREAVEKAKARKAAEQNADRK